MDMTPTPIADHTELLTLNANTEPLYENALPGVHIQPLMLDPQNGVWVVRAQFEPGVVLPRHYHTGDVHLFTTRGTWNYLEYPDQPQTAGSYLYEPGGSVHTFAVPADASEPAEALMVVRGANLNFDASGNYAGILDATWIMQVLDNLVKERGMKPPKYITPGASNYTIR